MKKQISNKVLRSVGLLLFPVMAGCIISGCSAVSGTDPVSMNGLFFDTSVNVSLYEYEGSSNKIFSGVTDMCKEYESLFSATAEGSDIWNINHADVYPVEVSPDTAELLEIALQYCEVSAGQLDICVGQLVELWDFSKQAGLPDPKLPSKEQIADAASHCDYQNIILEEQDGHFLVTLTDEQCSLELGCIAKGYIADKLYDYLKSMNVTSAVISLGGNVKVLGHKPDGSEFKIGIQKPFGQTGETITFVEVQDCSVVSSGIYERYFESAGHIYHHILDPSTGYPIDNNLYGITVKATDSVTADALSTLCFILGEEKGMELIESMDNTEAMFIRNDYSISQSSGWNN